jgi:hypothetical protein
MDGPIPKSTTYEQWLKSKPVEMQQQVLGQSRWQLWQDGKANLDQMVDGNGAPLSVAELHAAVQSNIAIPTAAAVDGAAGLTLGERGILSAMRTAAVQNDE